MSQNCQVPECSGIIEFSGGGHAAGGQQMHSHATCPSCGVVYTSVEGQPGRPDHRETSEAHRRAQEEYEPFMAQELVAGLDVPGSWAGDLQAVTDKLELAERGVSAYARWAASNP